MPATIYENVYEGQTTLSMDEVWDKVWMEKTGDFAELVKKIPEDRKYPFLERYLKKDGYHLEAGCGLGAWVFYLNSTGYNTIGIDFSKKAVSIAKKYNSSVPVEFGDLESLRFNDNTFDVIMSWGVIEHFINGTDKVLKETLRVCKNGGIVIIAVPYRNLLRRYLFEIADLFINKIKVLRPVRALFRKPQFKEKVFFEYQYTRTEILRIIRKHDFSIREVHPINHGLGMFHNRPMVTKIVTCPGTDELNKFGHVIVRLLTQISKWFTPHLILIIAQKKYCSDS